jgi:hypothetical protein
MKPLKNDASGYKHKGYYIFYSWSYWKVKNKKHAQDYLTAPSLADAITLIEYILKEKESKQRKRKGVLIG